MKCLSTELLLFFFKTVITDVGLCGLPGGLLLAPPAVKELSTITPRLTFKALIFFIKIMETKGFFSIRNHHR